MKRPRYVTFDAHVHVMTCERLRSGWTWLHRNFRPGQTEIPEAPTPKSLVHDLNQASLQGYFNFFFSIFPATSWHVNEWNDGFCSSQPGAIALLSMHPQDTPRERNRLLTEFLIKRNFAGLKIHSYVQKIGLDSGWLADVCAVLQEENRLLYLHTGFSSYYGSNYAEEEMGEHLAAILEAFPKLQVVAAHMLYPRMDIAFRLLNSYPGLYLDITGIPKYLHREGTVQEWVPYWEQHAHRMLFGSDCGINPETLETVIQEFESLPLSEKALFQIGGETARHIIASLEITLNSRQNASTTNYKKERDGYII
jgi:uncharacterized protein